MASDDGNQGSNHTEEQPPFNAEQVAWIDQLVAGCLPPTLQGHGAGDVAGGAVGTPASASLVTTAYQPGESRSWAGGGGVGGGPCCCHEVFTPSFRAGIIGRGPSGSNVANVVSKLLALPVQGCRPRCQAWHRLPVTAVLRPLHPLQHQIWHRERYPMCCHPLRLISVSWRPPSLGAQAFPHASSRRSGPLSTWTCGNFFPNRGG